jgi:hypothetical protein
VRTNLDEMRSHRAPYPHTHDPPAFRWVGSVSEPVCNRPSERAGMSATVQPPSRPVQRAIRDRWMCHWSQDPFARGWSSGNDVRSATVKSVGYGRVQVVCSVAAVLALLGAGCAGDGTAERGGGSEVVTTERSGLDPGAEELPGSREMPTTLVNPLLIADLVVETPLTGGSPEPGSVTDLRTGDQEQLFSLSDIDGDFNSSVSDFAVAEEGPAVLVYAAQQPDEGLTAGSYEIGLLIRPWEGSKFGRQVDVPLLSLDDPTVESSNYTYLRPQLIRAFPVFDRVVVIDFVDDRWWLIEADGTIEESRLGKRIANDPCTTADEFLESRRIGNKAGDTTCIEYFDIAALTSSNTRLGTLNVDRTNLLLVGSGPSLVRVDLESGQVTGPVIWPLGNWETRTPEATQYVLGSCSGTVLCISPLLPTSEATNEPVMNRFDPLTLEIDYRPVPPDLVDQRPYPFAGGLLWLGRPTVYTDLDGAERWRLPEHLGVGFVNIPSPDAQRRPGGFIYATNSSGESFELNIDSGEIDRTLDFDPNSTELIAVNERWTLLGETDMNYNTEKGTRYRAVKIQPRP